MRRLICKHCKGEFVGPVVQRFCSKRCAGKARGWYVEHPRMCECGKVYVKRSPNANWCPACRPKHRWAWRRLHDPTCRQHRVRRAG